AEVLAVAHALEAHKTLTGEDVTAVIEGFKGPLVDGRVYHEATFMELAEAYHVHAVQAHRGKAKVGVALPSLVRAAAADAEVDDYFGPVVTKVEPGRSSDWPGPRPNGRSNGHANPHDDDDGDEADDPTSS